ncbi:hypothetical protein ACFOWX_03180 [Sphingorhabdus arenilitoris]|uniref:DUF2065 domain-containing protein n=1 Tax=Sphingorhabdus arenilitoris TaxID=1490041 RepID=A0ABV8REP6_9SPHN
MTQTITAWILILIGLYSVAAAIGELRRRGTWARIFWELERSRTLQFLIGIMCMVIGATIMLVNPYNGLDLQSILVTILGGLILLEGAAFLAFPDWMIHLSRQVMNSRSAIWGWIALCIGMALMVVGYVRMLAS